MNSKALSLLLTLGIAGSVVACGPADTEVETVEPATEEVAPVEDPAAAPAEDPAAAPEGGEGGEGGEG